MSWVSSDYDTLRELTFAPDYPHKPKPEIPNGDGLVDSGKQYRHVAMKYLNEDRDGERALRLYGYLKRAHALALDVAQAFGLPPSAWPVMGACALRVLEYPAGVGGHRHTDFDLFTLSLYRSHPEALEIDRPAGLLPVAVQALNPGCHRGELLQELSVTLADPHSVLPQPEPQQSLVYFSLPSHDLQLPSGLTIGQWLAERYARSRA